MATKTISITGVDGLLKKLKTVQQLEAVKKVVKKNTAEMQEKAVRNTTTAYTKGYATGTTKRGIKPKIIDEGDGASGMVGMSMEYNPYLEEGTRFMAAAPVLKPAHQEQSIKFKKDLEDIVK